MNSTHEEGQRSCRKRSCGEFCYIHAIIFIIAVIATAATWGVLSIASSDSDSDTSSTLTTANNGPEQKGIEANVLTKSGTANVLTILLDDAGWGDFSQHAKDPWYALSTPNMDKIMGDGLYFSNFYTQSICTPARASLMTGRWTWVLGYQKEILYDTCMVGHLSEYFPTYAELTKEKGYTNYLYGKWHLGMDSWGGSPTGRGFDEWWGNFNSGGNVGGGGAVGEKGGWYSVVSNDSWGCNTSLADQTIKTRTYTECLMRSFDYHYVDWNGTTRMCYSFLESSIPDACSDYNTSTQPSVSGSVLYNQGEYVHLALRDQAIDFWHNTKPANPLVDKRMDMHLIDMAVIKLTELSKTPNERWTMMLSLKTPHQDGSLLENGTNTEVAKECGRYFDKESKYYNYDRGAICQKMYEVDERIGEIMELLKSLEIWDDTLIILTNDNGGTSGQNPGLTGAETEYNYAINYPLRGVKTSYYQGAVKTVLAITGGALSPSLRGTVNSHLHHISDIAPTILAVAGFTDEEFEDISNGTNFDGYSLLSTKTATYEKHDFVYLSLPAFTEFWKSNNTALVLADGTKYIGPGGDFGPYGYWGTLPTWETVGPKSENCSEGCVWDLNEDPFEENDIGYSFNQTGFHDLVYAAYKSDQWNDGTTANWASCSKCSCCQSCTYDNTSREYEGFYYYFPWIDLK